MINYIHVINSKNHSIVASHYCNCAFTLVYKSYSNNAKDFDQNLCKF